MNASMQKLLLAGTMLVAGLCWMGHVVVLCNKGRAITLANYERIQNGITQSEAEAILECPPGFYTKPIACLSMRLPSTPTIWRGDEGMVVVEFSEDKVVYKQFTASAMPPEAISDKVRRIARDQLPYDLQQYCPW